MAEGKDYVVYGMKAKCSEGTMDNYISTDKGHGVVYQDQPVLNANDHVKEVNLTHFGDCNSKAIFEEAKKQADEKYKAEEGDGFFTRLGKGIAKTVTKAVVSVKETFSSNKCELDTPLPWIFTSRDHMVDGAPALTMESQCACKFGGIITIVPVEEEAATEQEEQMEYDVESKAVPVEAARTLQMTAVGANASVFPKTEMTGVMPAEATAFIDKYVNEETLKKINSRWNIEELKKKCGTSVMDDLKKSMYAAGITDEKSVLMFLCTLGVESGYGTTTTEKYTDTYLLDKSYTKNTRGAGLIQVTGDTQKKFLENLRKGLSENDPKKVEINQYINAFGRDGKKTTCSKDATTFIANNYSVESATWFWAKNNSKCTYYYSKSKYEHISINKYVKTFANYDSDNVFLVSQYYTNGERWKTFRLQEICEASKTISPYSIIESKEKNGKTVKEVKYMVDFAGDSANAPNGWKERSEDWENAKKLMSPKIHRNKNITIN